MSRKPASLTSDLLARKGEAEPVSVDPASRATPPATPYEPSQEEAPDQVVAPMSEKKANPDETAISESPLQGHDEPPATERHDMQTIDEEERPRPPEPEIIYTPEEEERGSRTRLVAFAAIALAIFAGIIAALSLNDSGSGVAPVSPQVAGGQAPGENITPPAAAPAETADLRPSTTATPAEDEAIVPDGGATSAQPDTSSPATTSGSAVETVEVKPAEVKPVESKPVEAKPATTKPAETKPAATTPAPAIATQGAWVVQILALREEAAAQKAWDGLQKKHPSLLGGQSLDVEKADLGSKGVFYRVRAAGFTTKQAAQATCTKLKAAGQDCLVRSR